MKYEKLSKANELDREIKALQDDINDCNKAKLIIELENL